MPEIGKKLPNFSLPCVSATGETTASLANYSGQKLVLFFYPRDNTPGCTKESIEFGNLLAEFETANATVLGVSKDSVKSHSKFIAKHSLAVGLLSDENSDFCERMGVWGEKNMYGKTFMGITRSTFLVDGNGILRREWRKVKVPGHVEEVLAAVRDL